MKSLLVILVVCVFSSLPSYDSAVSGRLGKQLVVPQTNGSRLVGGVDQLGRRNLEGQPGVSPVTGGGRNVFKVVSSAITCEAIYPVILDSCYPFNEKFMVYRTHHPLF